MIAPPGIPNITSTPSASSERRIASAPFILILCPSVSRCLVPSPVASTVTGAVSVGVCTGSQPVRVDVSLAGENVNELDAYAKQCRTAAKGSERITVTLRCGEAEHLLQACPKRSRAARYSRRRRIDGGDSAYYAIHGRCQHRGC